MSSPLDQLNLRPQEKRVLVVVAFLIFVVLNFWLVRPLFGQWGKVNDELDKTRKTLARYQDEVAKAPQLERMGEELRKSGSEVLTAELQLQTLVNEQALNSGVNVSRNAPGVRSATGRTNQFFEDQGLTIDFTSPSTNLVQFLVGLASGNSMIRVQDLNLRPDPSGTRLAGSILFVASYQKKAPAAAKVASGSAPRPAPNAAKTTPATAGKPLPAAGKTNAAAKSAPPSAAKTLTNTARTTATNTAGAPKK